MTSAYDITGFLCTSYRAFAYSVPSNPLNTAYQNARRGGVTLMHVTISILFELQFERHLVQNIHGGWEVRYFNLFFSVLDFQCNTTCNKAVVGEHAVVCLFCMQRTQPDIIVHIHYRKHYVPGSSICLLFNKITTAIVCLAYTLCLLRT